MPDSRDSSMRFSVYGEARKYAIRSIRNFLEGTGGAFDWDDFTSTPLGFPDLDEIRRLCVELPAKYPPRNDREYCNDAGLFALRQTLDGLEAEADPG